MLNWTRAHFEAKGLDDPRLCAELLLAEALGCRKIELYTRFEQVPDKPRVDRFRELVQRASKHEPISYLIGRKEFFSLDFVVTRDVLIPRPETETLVERALAFAKGLHDPRIDVFDLGTGSGCIGIAVAKFEPRAHVVAADVSPAAVDVAAQNAERHRVADRVRTVVADGVSLPPDAVAEGGFHALLSNPPYIPDAVVDTLPAHIREYEPRIALAGGDGFVFFRRIAEGAARLLRPGGRVYLEVGESQASAVQALFAVAGWTAVGLFRDLGGVERVTAFERPA